MRRLLMLVPACALGMMALDGCELSGNAALDAEAAGQGGNLQAQDPCDNHECPEDMVCETVSIKCPTPRPPDEPEVCVEGEEAICVYPDPCLDFECPEGQHCEPTGGDSSVGGSHSEGPPEPECVDDPIDCEDDADCPGDLVCYVSCGSGSGETCDPSDPGCEEECHGFCGVYIEPPPDPCDEIDCPAGMFCVTSGGVTSSGVNSEDAGSAFCIEEPSECEEDADCPSSMFCPEPLDVPDPKVATRVCQYKDLCPGHSCPENQECVMILEPCETWPCVPAPTCVEVPTRP